MREEPREDDGNDIRGHAPEAGRRCLGFPDQDPRRPLEGRRIVGCGTAGDQQLPIRAEAACVDDRRESRQMAGDDSQVFQAGRRRLEGMR